MAIKPIANASVVVIPDFGKFESVVKGFAGRAGGLMSSVTAAVTGVGLAGIVGFGLKSAASLEQAQVGFQTLLGSGKKAQDFLTQLQRFAAATPFELPGLIDSSRTLLGVGLNAKQVIPLLTAFGDTAGAVGVGQEAFQRIILATSQAISAGKFQQGDLNQIMTNGIPIYTILSKAMGKPVTAIRQLASQGKLLASDVLPILQKQMEKDYGGAMAKQSQTLAGVWSTLKDSVAIGLSNAIKPLVPLLEDLVPKAANLASGALSGITTAIGTFISAAKGVDGPTTGLIGKFRLAGLGIRALITAFQTGQTTSDGFIGVMEKIGVAVKNALPGIMSFASNIGADLKSAVVNIAGVLEGLLPKLVSLAQYLGPKLAAAISTVLPIIGSIVSWFEKHRTTAAALVITMGALVAVTKVHAAVLTVQAAGGLVKYLKSINLVQAATKVWAAVQWLLNAAMDANPIALVVIAIAALVAAVIIAWKNSATFRDIVIGAWHGIQAAVKAVVGWFTGTVWPALKAVWDGIAAAGLWLWHNVFEPVWNGIKAIVGTVVGIVMGYIHLVEAEFRIIASVATWLYNNIFAPIFHAIGRVVQAGMAVAQLALKLFQVFIVGPIASAISWIYNKVIKPTFEFIAAVIRTEIGIVTSILTAIKNFLVGVFTAAWHGIQSTVSAVWSAISNAISKAWTWIKNSIFGDIVRWVTGTLVNGFHLFVAGVESTWSTVQGVLSRGWNWIKANVFNPIANFVKSTIPNAFHTAVDAVGKAWQKIQDVVKAPITFTVNHIINPLINGFDKIAKAFGTSQIAPIGGFAEGGIIPGTPSSTDNRWSWLKGAGGQTLGRVGLATGEFVVNARDTAKALPLLNWINQGMKGGPANARRYVGRDVADMPGDGSEGWAFSKGGLVGFLDDVWTAIANPAKLITKPLSDAISTIPGSGFVKELMVGMAKKLTKGLVDFATGGTSVGSSVSMIAAQSFLRAQNGKPYIWASAGPNGYDCSGIVSAIYNILKGKPVYGHTFSTESAQDYFTKPGFGGPLVAGWSHPGQAPASNSVGHMMGMLGGLTFESTGSRGVHLGSTTRKVTDFANIGHFDKGGIVKLAQIARADFGSTVLERGNNLIFNGTGQREPLVSPGSLSPARMHPDDIAALAQAIGSVVGGALVSTVPITRIAARKGGVGR